ncbi:MAG: NACHT and WD repeat domain-containing protein [Synechococcaceae cyanobacterium]
MTAARAAAGSNPYPGLRPFEEREEYLFFGRERQIDHMVDLLAQRRFLAVVGGSGCGKSSLVNCGLQPALRRGLMASGGTSWRMARFRPGLRPIEALAQGLAAALSPSDGDATASLAAADLSQAEVIATQLRLSRLGLVEVAEQAGIGPDANLLVVVDQFEELFRYQGLAEGPAAGRLANAQGEAQALVNLLLASGAQQRCPIHLVLTMRSDFLGDCARFTGLPEAITTSLYLVPRLSREERRQAIAMPALLSGTEIDPVLLTQLVNDVGDDPDQLSILQHALRRTWQHWRQRGGEGAITLADYEAIGTMATALDSHAEQTLAEVCKAEVFKTRTSGEPRDALVLSSRVFRALTDKASDPRGIRRPTTLAELQAICGGEPEAVVHVVDHFRQADRAFLMPPEGTSLSPDSVVDISHESLMRVWRRLDEWADQEAASAALFLRLADSAGRHGQGQASLWRDPELQLALDWRQREQPTEAWARRYANNHGEALAFLEASNAARAAEQRQLALRRQRTLAGLAAFSLLAAAVGAFSWWQWQDTRLSRARAYAATAAATLEQRPLQSMLYSLAALERLAQEPAEALGVAYTLARASLRNWELEQWEINPGGAGRQAISALLALRDGSAITAAGCGPGPHEGNACLRRWRGSKAVGEAVPTGLQEVTVLLELADGHLVTGGGDGNLRLWQLGQSLQPLVTPQAAGPEGTANPSASSSPIRSLVQLSDGEIVSGDRRGTLRRWRLMNKAGSWRLEPLAAPIATGVADIVLLALPNAELLSGGADPNQHRDGAALQLWRQGRPSGPPLRTGQTVVKQLLAWGDQVLSLGSEGRVELVNPSTGSSQQLALPGRGTRPDVDQLLALAGGQALLSFHSDGSLRLWQAEGAAPGLNAPRLQAVGQADSDELLQRVDLRGGRLLAADASDKLHLIQHPDPRGRAGERGGIVSTGLKSVNSLLAGPGHQLISGGGVDGRLCFWEAGRRLSPLAVVPGGQGGNCLAGSLGSEGTPQEATAVLLAPLANGAMLSATNVIRNPGSDQPETSVVFQRWQPGQGKGQGAWGFEPLPAASAWIALQDLLAAGDGEMLGLGSQRSDPNRTGLWRWTPLGPAAPAVALRPQLGTSQQPASNQPGTKQDATKQEGDLSWFKAVRLGGGDLLTANAVGGSLRRWRPQGAASLQATETLDTGLDAIGALALLPGDRYLVVASGQQTGEAALVQVFDLVNKVWVGQPIPVPRPFGADSGTVAATALAALPDGGLAIGTNRGDLLAIQPQQIRADACHQLKPLLRGGFGLQRSRSGIPAGVSRLSREACKASA